jgi:hypothetical protein
MKRIILAALAGGLVLFVWGAVAWMLIPMRESSIRQLPDEKTVIASMQKANAQRGVYFFGAGPGKTGPQGLFVYTPSVQAMTGGQLARTLVFDIVAALFVAWLLSRAATASFGGRVLFVAVAGGLIAAMVVDLPNWNWFAYPLDYTLGSVADKLIGWALAGLALAAIVRPRAAAAEVAA